MTLLEELRIEVPVRDRVCPQNRTLRLLYQSPALQPAPYTVLDPHIRARGMQLFTPAEMVSLIYEAAVYGRDKRADILRNEFGKHWLWCNAGIEYSLSDGIFIQDDPPVHKGEVRIERAKARQVCYRTDIPTEGSSRYTVDKREFAIQVFGGGVEGEKTLERFMQLWKKDKWAHSEELPIWSISPEELVRYGPQVRNVALGKWSLHGRMEQTDAGIAFAKMNNPQI